MGKIKVSFKKINHGKDGIWDKYLNTHIKINGVVVGDISSEKGKEKDGVKIRVMVVKSDIMEDGNKNCVWRWITFKKTFDTEELARIWFKDTLEGDGGIMSKWNLFMDRDGG
jgi:hypothetical protein